MTRLTLALQGYDSLAASLQRSLDERASDQAEAWLLDEVCPVAEELSRDAAFRRHARWSLERLGHGAGTDERRLVEQTDHALVSCAGKLACAMAAGEVRDAGDGEQESSRFFDPAECAAVSLLASRPWFDLVCSDDFLHPAQELFLRNPAWKHTHAFRQGPELRLPLGDYITRMLLARVAYWRAVLDRAFNHAFFGGDARLSLQAREELFSAKIELDQACERLTAACHQRGKPLREACMTLVQVYAAYAPCAELDWLELPPGLPQARQALIRSCIRRPGELVVAAPNNGQWIKVERRRASLCDLTGLRHVAAALEELKAFYELPADDGERLRWALERAKLVMVDSSPRAVYWDGQPVAEDAWDANSRVWDLLWALARHPGRFVNQTMLVNPDVQTIRSRRHRLGRLLAAALELDSFIENCRGEGYRLTLKADDVLLLSRQDRGQLELHPAAVRR